MKTLKTSIIALVWASMLLFLSTGEAYARKHSLYIVQTGDVHSAWFRAPYVEGQQPRNSLMSVKYYVDSLRAAVGAENVLLLDAGDCLQGDNAAYYYNYVDTSSVHLFSRICKYMGYDAVVVGNHDIETGHAVYDRVYRELEGFGIPWLGGNALRSIDRKAYFPVYTIMEKAGLKVAVLGFTNPNMAAWLSEELWSGMEFLSLLPYVQRWVDVVHNAEKPDVVVVAVHSGTGPGDGSVLESQGLDLLKSLTGVDVLITSHDHRPIALNEGSTYLLNAGARAGNVGTARIDVDKRGRKIRSKTISTEIVRLDRDAVDEGMAQEFASDFEAVRAFTCSKVGRLEMDLHSREAFAGMSDFINLIHTVQLSVPEAQISFAAPLGMNSHVKAGEIIYNDLFTIYPYENQLFVVSLSGREIREYLEYSYNAWIETPGEHVLKIRAGEDPRYGTTRWSFTAPSYNFDSAAGLNYTVDVTKPYGSRVSISSLADGTAFELDADYRVAMTSYRASGGGGLMPEGAGVGSVEDEGRVLARYPEIREMIYNFFKANPVVGPAQTGDKSVLGEWKFVPEETVAHLMENDMRLMFD